MNDGKHHTQPIKYHFRQPQRKKELTKTHYMTIKQGEKNKLLSAADLNVQNMLSSLLINMNEETKSSLLIEKKLKLIDHNKKIILNHSYQSSDDSSSSSQSSSIPNNIPLKQVTLIKAIKPESIIHFKNNDNETLSPVAPLIKKVQIKGNQRNSIDLNINCDINRSIIKESKIDNQQAEVIQLLSINKENMNGLNSICREMYNSMNIKPKNSQKESIGLSSRLMMEDIKNINENEEGYNISLKSTCQDYSRKLYKKQVSVYDSLSDEELDDQTYNDYFISPNSYFKYTFDAIIAIGLFISLLYLPYALAFKLQYHSLFNMNFYLSFFIELSFFSDIIISFFVGYYNIDDQMVIDLKMIIHHYMRKWFIIDLIAGFPYSTIIDLYMYFEPSSSFTRATYNLYSNNPLRLLNLFQLCRFVKTIKVCFNNSFMLYCFKTYLEDHVNNKWALLYGSLFLYAAAVNILGAVFIFLGFSSYPSWIEANHQSDHYPSDLYITSIYFICTTTFAIGYGDITSENFYERIFNVILLIFGIITHSWTVTTLSSLFEYKDEQTQKCNDKLAILEQIRISHSNMPNLLCEKIKRFFLYSLEQEQANPAEILELLPYKLRGEVIFEIFKNILNDFVFFKSFNNKEFNLKVLLSLKPIIALRNEQIVTEGDFIEEMIFVKRGTLAIELPIPSIISEQCDKVKEYSCIMNTLLSKNTELRKVVSKQRPSLNSKLTKITSIKTQKDEEDKNNEKSLFDRQYVKLIEIRRNEHFGDVMMFLNHRCPLRVRIKSKRAELLLLKKIDAVFISSSFPHIWKKIIKKSTHNWIKINNLIVKTLRLFFISNQKNLENIENNFRFVLKNAQELGFNNLQVNDDESEELYDEERKESSNFVYLPLNNEERGITDMIISEESICDNKGNGDKNSVNNQSINASDSVNFNLLQNYDEQSINSSSSKAKLFNYKESKTNLLNNTENSTLKKKKSMSMIQTKEEDLISLQSINSDNKSFGNASRISYVKKTNILDTSRLSRYYINDHINSELHSDEEEIIPSKIIPLKSNIPVRNYFHIFHFPLIEHKDNTFSIFPSPSVYSHSSSLKASKTFNRKRYQKTPSFQHKPGSITITCENNSPKNTCAFKPNNSCSLFNFTKKKTEKVFDVPKNSPNILMIGEDANELNITMRSNELSYADIFEQNMPQNKNELQKCPSLMKRNTLKSNKSGDMLDLIGDNIRQVSDNLNFPSFFYSMTFNNMIKENNEQKENDETKSQMYTRLKTIDRMIKNN